VKLELEDNKAVENSSNEGEYAQAHMFIDFYMKGCPYCYAF